MVVYIAVARTNESFGEHNDVPGSVPQKMSPQGESDDYDDDYAMLESDTQHDETDPEGVHRIVIAVFAITIRSGVEERRVGCVEEREEEEGARTTYRPKEC